LCLLGTFEPVLGELREVEKGGMQLGYTGPYTRGNLEVWSERWASFHYWRGLEFESLGCTAGFRVTFRRRDLLDCMPFAWEDRE